MKCLIAQGFRQFCKVADIFLKAPDLTFFWRRKALCERRKLELPREVWGHVRFRASFDLLRCNTVDW